MGLGLLCFGGLFVAGYLTFKGMFEEVGPVAESYLRGLPELETEIGGISKVEATFLGSSVHVRNDAGAAHVACTITAGKGVYPATVYLERKNGRWSGVGAAVTIAGKSWKAGVEVQLPKSSGGDWDD